jgi:stage II sporulation protein D
MRVALSVTLPFEFLLEQDALVFPLLAAEPVDKAEEASNGHEVDDNEQYISLGSSRELFRIRKGELPREVVLCHPSGKTVSFLGGLRIVPVDCTSPAFRIKDALYPGELQIVFGVSKSGCYEATAINLVDIEAYVEGVLAGEVYPSWAPEALKAQAVASRTYALRRKADNESRNYDVDDTVLSQVYVGENRVDAFRIAVLETRGQVLVYEDVPIRAHYFSSGGGTTEGDEEVWLGGRDEPYLTAREDFDWKSPHYRWKEPLVMKSQDLLGKLGLRPDFPAWIEPSIRSDSKILAYRFRAGDQVINLTREQIRHRIGLQSPRFDITITDGEGEGKLVSDQAELSPSAILIFDGVGKGHGVGLSQWGAQGMASILDSNGVPLYTYVDILKHYYPGTELVNNCNIPKEYMEPACEDQAELVCEGEGFTESVHEDHVEPVSGDHVETMHEDHAEPSYDDCAGLVHEEEYTEPGCIDAWDLYW